MAVLQLCLSAVGRERQIISIAQDATFHDLYERARQAFDCSSIELKHGFPPRVLQDSPHDCLHTSHVLDKDRIQVLILDDRTKETTNNKARIMASSSCSPKRTQRAAAKAATDSFGQVIRAQEEALMKQQQGSQKKRKRNTNSQPRNNYTTSSRQLRQPSTTPGRRLADGAIVGGGPKKKPTSNKAGSLLKNEEDVAMALMGALNGGGGGGGKVGQVLRGAMRNAISNSYEASRAVVKVSCLESKRYTIIERDGRLEIEYDKGLEGRGTFSEVVDSIPRDALEAVLTAIYSSDRELLRAATLAQLSPRVFWSLFHIFPSCTSVREALQSLLPNLDWSFLESRKKTLSAKAKENLRQLEGEPNIEAAAEVVHAVEDAMDQLSAYDASRRRDRAARAAMARNTPASATWHLVTPTEYDEEELKECIQISGTQAERVISVLRSMNILNWRQLANANVSSLAESVHLPETQVESWVDHAQAQSVEEIMVEICDNRVEVVEILRDEARTGTPKDLANWRHLQSMLYESAPSLVGKGVEIQDICTWCQRSQDVLEEWEWVNWYATPVE